MNIPEKALQYFDSGEWCRGDLGTTTMPRCVGGSLNLALTNGRFTSWQMDPFCLKWYWRLADIMIEQFPDRAPLHVRVLGVHKNDTWVASGAIETINDHDCTTREEMRLCLEKLAASETIA